MNDSRQETLPSASPNNECHPDEGTKWPSAAYLRPDYTAGTSTGHHHSRSPSPSPSSLSQHSQHSQIFPSIPEQNFIRRNTASWFERGKMFEISRSNDSTGMAGSSMIVVGRKHSSIVCLPVYRHPGIKGHERSFFKARVSLYAKGKRAPSHLAACPCEPLKIALEDGRELSDDVWISVGEPRTIHHQDVEVALHGNMSVDDFRKLRGAYLVAQDSITDNDQKKRPNTLVLHAEILWCYITRGGEWLGQRLRIVARAEG